MASVDEIAPLMTIGYLFNTMHSLQFIITDE